MKRVNIRNGLNQRMHEILGTDYETIENSENIPNITPWSIQAAMISNMRRIVSAIVGAIPGRAMYGLFMTKVTSNSILISSGYGFTQNGNVVILETPINFTIDESTNTKHVYLKHVMSFIDGDLYDDGKKTGFYNKSGLEDIVYDDLAASKKNDVNSVANSIVEITDSSSNTNHDVVYLGSLTFTDNVITTVYNSELRGLEPNNIYGDLFQVKKFNCNQEAFFNGNASFYGGISILNAVSCELKVLDIEENEKTLTFVNGILMSIE